MRSFKLALAAVLSLSVCLFLLLIVMDAIWAYVFIGSEISSLQDEIRRNGHPVTMSEVNAYYPAVPEEQNAALVYLRATDELDYTTDLEKQNHGAIWDKVSSVSGSAPYDEILRGEVEAYLNQHSALLVKLGDAQQLPHSRYPLDLTQGAMVKLPHLAALRCLTRAVSIRAFHQVRTGDLTEIANAHRTMRHLAWSLEDEPLLISQLVRVVLISIAVESLERDLNYTTITQQMLVELQEIYRKTESPNWVVRAMAVERATAFEGIKQMFDGRMRTWKNESTEDTSFVDNFWWLPGMRVYEKKTQAYLLKKMGPLASSDPKSWLDRLAAAKGIEFEDNAFAALANIYVQPFSKAPGAFARLTAKLELARAAVAVERHVADYQEYPMTLQELVPRYLDSVPIDPFDNNFMRYRRLGDTGYLLYSVSHNGDDDGGEPHGKDEHGNYLGDWCFRVERPALTH